MKMTFRFCKIVTACLFIFSTFPYCTPSIWIVSGDPSNGNLKIIDAQGNPADTFNAVPGQKIDWKIVKNSNVASITQISKADVPNNDDLFKKHAHKKWLSSKWRVKLGKKGGVEEYNIDWTDNQKHSQKYDPKIQILLMGVIHHF